MFLPPNSLMPHVGKPNYSLPLKIVIQSKYIGAIIGHGGDTIREISKTSQAKCVIDMQTQTFDELGNQENTIVISGTLDSCSKACAKILQFTHEIERDQSNNAAIQLKIRVLNDLIGRLIGKGGSSVKAIMEATGATISVNKANQPADYNYYPIIDRSVTIRGNSIDVVLDAERKISQKLRHYYEADAQAKISYNVGKKGPNLSPMLPFPSPLVFPLLNSPTMYANSSDCASTHYRLSNLNLSTTTMSSSGGPASAPPMMLCHSPYSPKVKMLPNPVHLKTRIHVPSCFVGTLIGSKGSYIRSMMQFTGAVISIEGLQKERRKQSDKEKEKDDFESEKKKAAIVKSAAGDADDNVTKSTSEGEKDDDIKEKTSPCKKKSISGYEEPDRCVSISGYDFQVYKAEYFIYKRIADSSHCYMDELVLSTEIIVPNKIIGRIVGKNGRNLMELQAVTQARIQVHDRAGATKKSDTASGKEAEKQETAVGVTGNFHSLQAVQSHFCNLITEYEMHDIGDIKTRMSTFTSLLSPLTMNELSSMSP